MTEDSKEGSGLGAGCFRRLLAGTPWSARAARGPCGRSAYEIYERDTLVGVLIDTPVAVNALRGARRAGRGRRTRAIAWGRLPPGRPGVEVAFLRHLPRPSARAAEFASLGDWGWIAVAEGRFSHVQVAADGRRLRRKLRTRWEQ